MSFGPGGDLFTIEHLLSGAVVSQFHRNDSGPGLRFVTRVSGPMTGECGFVVDPAHVGCPTDTGPQITFDPPVPFDHVTGSPILAGTSGSGAVERTGSSPARWQVTLTSATPIDCTDDTCTYEWLPGPAGSAVYVPYVDDPAGGNHLAAFVVDSRATAHGALLGPCDAVLGMIGTELIGFQYIDGGRRRLVAIDLKSLLA
jgi:hypothetical protein